MKVQALSLSLLMVIFLVFVFGGVYWSSSHTNLMEPAYTAFDNNDPPYNTGRDKIIALLASKNYHQALIQAANTISYVAQKRSQPKFLQNYQLMDMLEFAAKAYEGEGIN